MKRLSFVVFLAFFYASAFCFEAENSLAFSLGRHKLTGFKSMQMNVEGIYDFCAKFFDAKAGISFDAESFDFAIQLLGKYDFHTQYFACGAGGGILYHDLWLYDIFVDQDFMLVAGGYIGCPLTKTKIYLSGYYGWKNTTVYAVAEQKPFLTDAFANYDFGISQDIFMTSWQLGFATYSLFRHDFRFIPELYLNGKVGIINSLSVISSVRLQFSDISNKTCHPEYLFFKAGVEWKF